jgi:hypothetical protein
VIGLHVTGELPGVIRDLDVDRGKREVVPVRLAASVHAHLSVSGHVSSSMRPRARFWDLPAGGAGPASEREAAALFSRRAMRRASKHSATKERGGKAAPLQRPSASG